MVILSNAIAGGIASISCCVLFQPLDVIKTRYQQQQSLHLSYSSILRGILHKNPVRTLWSGTAPSLLRTVPGSCIYFYLLEGNRHLLTHSIFGQLFTDRTSSNLTPLGNFCNGVMARASAGFLIMPMSVLKTRFESGIFGYSSVLKSLSEIVRKEGICGLFRGYGAQLLRDAPQNGIFLVLYKEQQRVFGGGPYSNGVYAFTASFLSCALTQPFDIVRTRIQLFPDQSLSATLAGLKRGNIIVNLFCGFLPRVIRRSLSAGFTWGLFEVLRRDNLIAKTPEK